MAIEAGSSTYYQAKRGIVQDGLVLHLDAGVKESYPGFGDVWYDLMKNFNVSLINSPVFIKQNGGSFLFDGINSYGLGENTSTVNNHYSLEIIFKNIGPSSFNDTYGAMLFAQSNNIHHGIIMQHGYVGQGLNFSGNINNGLVTGTNTVFNNIINYAIGTYDGLKQKIYLNNILINQRNWTTNPVLANPALQIARWGYPGYTRYFNGYIYIIRLYNKALSPQEIQQNFNATRGRYGI